VTLTLTLREAPAATLDAAALSPDRLAGLSQGEIERLSVWIGRQRATVGELFDVSGAGEEDVRVTGDLARVGGLGTGMRSGRLTVAGDAGAHVGARMQDGELIVEGDCDRVRLTADGQVRNCLFARDESDLRTAMRAGASDEELAQRWVTAMAGKLPGHGINDPAFLQPDRPMSAIGG
jgi:hypothetical protein